MSGCFTGPTGPWWWPGWAQRQARDARRRRGPGPFREFKPCGPDAAGTLPVAPGGRFRVDGADGTWALGSDGTRMWHWFRDRPAGTSVSFGLNGAGGPPGTPYRDLLAPAWLLTGYSLALDGEETVAGRPGVRVRGTLRPVAAPGSRVGGRVGGSAPRGLFAPMPRWMHALAHQGEADEPSPDADGGETSAAQNSGLPDTGLPGTGPTGTGLPDTGPTGTGLADTGLADEVLRLLHRSGLTVPPFTGRPGRGDPPG